MAWKRFGLLCAVALPLGCGGGRRTEGESAALAGGQADDAGAEGTPGDTGSTGGSDPDGDDDDDGAGSGTVFDVGRGSPCGNKEAGVYCIMGAAVACDGHGNETSNDSCAPGYCVDAVGCVACLEGMYDCKGADVLRCDTSGVPEWEVIETCDAASLMVCDIASGTCIPSAPVGGTEATGDYYKYADFAVGDVFEGGYDVDGLDDRLYVINGGIDVYAVELLDTDGDGLFEPNQHPDNPEVPGMIETRVLTFVETIYGVIAQPSSSELFVLDDRAFVGGETISELIFATGTRTLITDPPYEMRAAHLGYDELNGTWYCANENHRRVYQHDASTDTWGIAFDYPELAGGHMDGMEVVVDPNTGLPFVYVSDMTSDFIGQYRKDPYEGWVQQNLFAYVDAEGEPVEGMGFGPLHHFWATSGSSLYEVGGGDLQQFVEPEG